MGGAPADAGRRLHAAHRLGQEAGYVDELLATFTGRVEGPREFALAHRVLLLYGSARVPLDIALGAMPFEERCIDRASAFDIGEGQSLLTCSAEDLVVFKAFAGRERDWLDIDTIIARQRHGLDVDAIWRELTPLLELTEDAETPSRLRRMLTKASGLRLAERCATPAIAHDGVSSIDVLSAVTRRAPPPAEVLP